MQKWIILIVVLITIVLGGFLIFNFNIETEYIPETEIEDIELRKTIVSLYFQNRETKELQKETRLIDSKNLLQNPYKELINMLILGPQTEKLEGTIPEKVEVLSATLKSNCVIINFSKEFMENSKESEIEKFNTIYSIVNTLTELTEVDSIKILIEGEETDEFSEVGIDLKNEVTKINSETVNEAEKEVEVTE